jgi:hypothetical protein
MAHRTKLDFKRQATAPPAPLQGDERLYADAGGVIRQVDDDGNDAPLAGATDTSALEARIAALETPHGTVGPAWRP